MDRNEIKQNGRQLLNKSRKSLIRIIFNRKTLLIVSLLLQAYILFGLYFWFEDNVPLFLGGSTLFTVAIMLILVNSSMDPSAKITWLVIIDVLPVFGCALYVWTQSEWGRRTLQALVDRSEVLSHHLIRQKQSVLDNLRQEDPGAAGLARYIHSCGNYPVYTNTRVTYFPQGEDKWARMLLELEKAKHYIYLEYFILREGLMWGKVLEILERKVRQGVDVRLLYDGTCELTTLPEGYPQKMEALGIRCKMFCPISPIVSSHYNYRDHRKILVIDGKVAFTGGVNLADEYINHVNRFGHWKDTAIMLEGDAVESFSLMFWQMWNVDEKEAQFPEDLSPAESAPVSAKGYVIPYGDCPLDKEKIGEMVYIDILNRANDYVFIMTPYLILDGEMESALKFTAQRGVDVRIILPGIPDKKIPYALAKTHYKSLLSSGVKIYEYAPGFVHAKVFLSDQREAVVGTINLDYRSLYHHFECAAYLKDVDCLEDIRQDFQNTMRKCRMVTRETIRREPFTVKLTGYLAKVIAPLL